ncbi:MAG: AI-2E family transporter [Gloeocapsa sp. DLM2.Bin57]|nr:MAG: AI-2E family transporter [Gloeocapsa sp. DLM2.Bin57]
MKFGQWLGLLSLILAIYIIWHIRQLILLVFTAVIIATALNRLVCRLQRWRWLQRWQFNRTLAIVIVLLATTIIAFLCTLVIVPAFIEQFQQLMTRVPAFSREVYESLQKLEQELDWIPELPTLSDLVIQLPNFTTDLFKNFLALFSNSLFVLLRILFVIVLTVMMLVDPQAYRKGLLRLFPSFYRRRANEILTLTETSIANWVIGILINCFFIGSLSGIGLSVLKIDFVLVHALLAGLLNFIPNFGPTASVIFPIMVAVLDEPWKIIAILIWYFIIQNIESYWLTPMVMAKQVSLLPAVTLMAQIFFTSALGVLGLLLALPLTVVAKTWIEELLFKDILDHWNTSSFEIDPFADLEHPDHNLETDILPLLDNHDNETSEVGEI